jgi:hypothetical protein
MKDEKLYTQFGSIRSGFLATPIFDFLTLGGSLARTGSAINVNFYQNFRNLITFPKLAHLLRYSNGNPKNFA